MFPGAFDQGGTPSPTTASAPLDGRWEPIGPVLGWGGTILALAATPILVVLLALLVVILGGAAIATMPVDIFPFIDIPVVSVLWTYSGLTPEEMEKRVVTTFERNLSANVNDIEHIESQCYNGIAVVRVYFHPNVQIDLAVAQVGTQMSSSLRNMPPGMFPAQVLKYDAASVPIMMLGLSSKTLKEQEITDLGNNFIRTQLYMMSWFKRFTRAADGKAVPVSSAANQ